MDCFELLTHRELLLLRPQASAEQKSLDRLDRMTVSSAPALRRRSLVHPFLRDEDQRFCGSGEVQ